MHPARAAEGMVVLDEGASMCRAVCAPGTVLARLIPLFRLGPVIKVDLDPGCERVVVGRGSAHVVEGD